MDRARRFLAIGIVSVCVVGLLLLSIGDASPTTSNLPKTTDRVVGQASTATNTVDTSPIMILATGRSGSSFLGSVFAAHPSSLYFIEPCQSSNTMAGPSLKHLSCQGLLAKVIACDFKGLRLSPAKDYSKVWPGWTGWGNMSSVERCAEQRVVVKEILIDQFEPTTWPGAKLIVLVRDPRAVALSRKGAWFWKHNDHRTKAMCEQLLNLVHAADRSGPEQALLVRYEDFAADPVAVTQQLFEFVGLSFDSTVATHIHSKTTGDCEHTGTTFSVCRDARAHKVHQWKEKLPLEEIRFVEEQCREYMSAVGYEAHQRGPQHKRVELSS